MPVVPHPMNMKKEEEEKAFKLYVNFFKGRRRKLIGKYHKIKKKKKEREKERKKK